MRNSIYIDTIQVDESSIPLGASKFGGSPDLPVETEWPTWNDKPLAFLAQVRLDEVAPYDKEGALPTKGILYFFYMAEEQPWGFGPEDKGSARVLYNDRPSQQLVRTAPPEQVGYGSRFAPCSLAFSTELTLPPVDSEYIEQLQLTRNPPKWNIDIQSGQIMSMTPSGQPDLPDKEWEDYLELLDWYEEGLGSIAHRLMGHPDTIQGDMQLECQLVSNGINADIPEGYEDPRVEALKEGAADWRLLLQIDSDDNTEWMWGDAGRIYYWIRQDDLAASNFDNIWLVLQCY